MKKSRLLYLVILLEGYIVLASELLAIRQLIPFVGSGVETTSIVISAVLLPLAIGYHFGGIAYGKAYAAAVSQQAKRVTIRSLLLKNVLVSLWILAIGFSYLLIDGFFFALTKAGITHQLLQTALYCLVFLIIPMFKLGQTVPLASHFFSQKKLSAITGRMLFFSTLGAFLGSIFSTLVLMSFVGVHNTVILTIVLLALLGLLVAGKKKRKRTALIGAAAVAFVVLVNNGPLLRMIDIVSDNAYSIVRVKQVPDSDDLLFLVNRSIASIHSTNPENRAAYASFVEQHFIEPFADPQKPKLDILVIGAGGFELGLHDTKNNYVYVDIDKDIKQVAEEHFQKEKLTPNKRFVPASARAFVRSDTALYDLIVIDVCTNMIAMPMEAVTREFLLDVKARLKKGGSVIANTVTTPAFSSRFAARYANTFGSVFPLYSRVPLDQPDPMTRQRVAADFDAPTTVLHIYNDRDYVGDQVIYTDDKNTYSMDMPQ